MPSSYYAQGPKNNAYATPSGFITPQQPSGIGLPNNNFNHPGRQYFPQ